MFSLDEGLQYVQTAVVAVAGAGVLFPGIAFGMFMAQLFFQVPADMPVMVVMMRKHSQGQNQDDGQCDVK